MMGRRQEEREVFGRGGSANRYRMREKLVSFGNDFWICLLYTSLRPARANLKSDVIAGLTFAVVNVPQAMAHALLATVNPVLGIYTLMVAVPVGAIFTSSVYMNVSTTSALSVAAGAALADIPEVERAAALAAMVLLVGACLLYTSRCV